ncbi:MAG: efflux RND transporter periplasmic adaptor subunit [Acidobacteriia bacterium]|nr:efflux RND transporter periplasmic adaptor subunit [Terriglobia bacterium]
MKTLQGILLISIAAGLGACGRLQHADSPAADKAEAASQPGLFTVPPDQLAHLQTVAVRKATWLAAIRTTGTVDWDANHTTQAIAQVSGPISRILVDAGAKVKAGDPLLYVSSPDVAAALSAYRKARNREQLNQRIVDRQKELIDRGAIATKDYESAVADYNDAMTDVQNSLQALKIFGIDQQQIDQADQQGKTISPELAVRAPIAGDVVQRLVSPGMLIQAGMTVCFVLSDVSTVWVQGHIFDRDLPSVRVGDPVEERNPSFPQTFRGSVTYVGAFVDPATRTTPVRIVTENPRGLLKKDMFVDAVIRTGTQNNVLVVPVSAVLRDDKNEPMVYVQAQPGRFAQRSVVAGAQQDGLIAIDSGLQPGEMVVSDGSLFLQFANSIL